MKTIKSALILEDSVGIQRVLSEVLQQVLPDLDVTQASSLRQAREALHHHKQFNLAIVSIGLPDGDGIEFVRELKQQTSDSYVVMCTNYDDDNHLFKALRAGADGYLIKQHSRKELTTILKGLLNGQPPLSPTIAQHILDSFHQSAQSDTVALTNREIEVLTLGTVPK